MAASPIHIALAANPQYVNGLLATLVSLIRSAKEPDRIVFHIFSDGLSDDNIRTCQKYLAANGYHHSLDIRDTDLSRIASRFRPYRGSYTAYLRLLFPQLFPELDWILWTDVDTLWFRDVEDLWQEQDDSISLVWARDMFDSQISASRDFKPWHPDFDYHQYACSGIVLMNLRRLRTNNFVEACFEFEAKWGTPPHPDQDMLNEICYCDTKLVDDRWGCMRPAKDISTGVVLHCVGVGPSFATGFSGWLPADEIWHTYFSRLTKANPVPVSPLHKRIVWNILGLVNPPLWIAKILSLPFRRHLTAYNLWRTMYLCWLRRILKTTQTIPGPSLHTTGLITPNDFDIALSL